MDTDQLDDDRRSSSRSAMTRQQDLNFDKEHDRHESSSLHFSDVIDAKAYDSDQAVPFDERDPREHLGDFESSFLPDSIPSDSWSQKVGADDTFLNFGSPERLPAASAPLGLPQGSSNAQQEDDGLNEEDADEDLMDESEDTGDQGHADSGAIVENNTTARGSELSSPAAAAAHRNNSRVAPSSMRKEDVSRQNPSEPSDSPPRSLRRSKSSKSSPIKQPKAFPTPRSSQMSSLAQQRPSYGHSRQASQQSTTSSGAFSDLSETSDVTISADYALQTGGSVPSDSPVAARPRDYMARLPSLGSVASDMSRDDEAAMPAFNRAISGFNFGSLSRLDALPEERSSVTASPITPRPTASQHAGITDTAIAQHVRDIQVPNTIAQEYRQRHQSYSPEKRPLSSSTTTLQGRPQSTLTLKEQNSKIDKLTKENFDLKLKIHFLDQALQTRSDEGVKDMINKNVQYQTDLANERKESQSLRRRLKELEQKLHRSEEEVADAQESANEAHLSGHADMEIEISELRQQVDHCQVRITKLSAENLAKELEKRKMAEYMSSLTDRKGSEQSAAEEEAVSSHTDLIIGETNCLPCDKEMWKDLLTTESSRREQAEEDLRRLREEIIVLRSDKATRDRRVQKNSTRGSGASDVGSRNGAVSASSATLVEHLRHENVELRRDLGAQTSMLTSRNRERERLQQEIEDLKLMHRKGDGARSLAGDSIFERSASRAHQRSASRASGRTGVSQISEADREEWEKREGMLRDQNAELRLDFQELEKETNAKMDYINQLEDELKSLDGDLAAAVEDLKALQKERDDALRALDDRDADCERLTEDYKALENEAFANIENLEASLERTEKGRKKIGSDLRLRNEDFAALQTEVRSLSEKMMQLEDDREINLKRLDTREQELEEATQELESLDKKLQEANQKTQRLEIQHESLHGEIAFLREEQEADKIKIGELENSLHAAQQSVHDEKEKMQELEASLVEERRQREIVDDQSKQDVQKVINDLNTENAKNKDEVRKLRRGLSTKEVEAATYKNRLEELENNLRHALGDQNGTRASLLNHIETLQNDLETTVQQLDEARAGVSDKDRLIRSRDVLLESSGLESRRLSELLDKERSSHKHTVHQLELAQRGQTSQVRSVAQQESRMLELETAKNQEKRKVVALELQFREQITERNNLLLALWNRLSTVCGQEWTQSHRLIGGEVPSIESISKALPAFNRNIIDATRQIESILGTFKSRLKNLDKTLSKDYQTLENNLDARTQRMDFLENAVKEAQSAISAQRAAAQVAEQQRQSTSRSLSGRLLKSNPDNSKVNKLEAENKTLKAELKFHRQHPSQQAQERMAHDAAAAANYANRRSSTATTTTSSLSPRAIAQTLLRHHSTSAVETINHNLRANSTTPSSLAPGQASTSSAAATAATSGSNSNRGGGAPMVIATPPHQPSEQRWIHRLKEMERRLKAEREARLLDRRGARQRLEERSAENEELKAMLEREKERRGSTASFYGDGSEFGGPRHPSSREDDEDGEQEGDYEEGEGGDEGEEEGDEGEDDKGEGDEGVDSRTPTLRLNKTSSGGEDYFAGTHEGTGSSEKRSSRSRYERRQDSVD